MAYRTKPTTDFNELQFKNLKSKKVKNIFEIDRFYNDITVRTAYGITIHKMNLNDFIYNFLTKDYTDINKYYCNIELYCLNSLFIFNGYKWNDVVNLMLEEHGIVLTPGHRARRHVLNIQYV